MSVGASSSKASSQNTSEANSQSEQMSNSQSGQTIAFEDMFRQLYGNASTAARGAVAGAGELGQTAKDLFSGGSQFLQGLGGDAGSRYLNERVNGSNEVLDENIAALREDTGRLFREELNPAITSRAVAGGTLGGGRQGVAQGLAAEAATQQFTRGATALRTADASQRDAVAGQIAQNSLQSASTGLGALPGLFDLATKGNNSELGVYSLLGSILGGPTTLSSSSSSSLARAFSEAFSQGNSKSSSFGVSLGV